MKEQCTSLIPFLEDGDAKRALMGSSMQHQAVPLMRYFFKIDFDRFEDPDGSETDEDYEMINMNAVCFSSTLRNVNK